MAIRNSDNESSTIMAVPTGRQPPAGPLSRAISAEVRAAIGRHRISGIKLARRAGLSSSYLGKRLRDEVSLSFNDLESICEAMGEDPARVIAAAFERLNP